MFFLRSPLILSSDIRLLLPSCSFTSYFEKKICLFYVLLKRALSPPRLILNTIYKNDKLPEFTPVFMPLVYSENQKRVWTAVMNDVINPSLMKSLPTPIWQCCLLNAHIMDAVPPSPLKLAAWCIAPSLKCSYVHKVINNLRFKSLTGFKSYNDYTAYSLISLDHLLEPPASE